MRGGNYSNGSGAGVFALNLNNLRTISNNNVGFRSALLSQPEGVTSRGCIQCREDKGACFHAERQKNLIVVEADNSRKANSATHDTLIKKILGIGHDCRCAVVPGIMVLALVFSRSI